MIGASMIGQTLLHYRIVSKLGEGGMGAVYRAEDTKLKRDVALKVLPPELAGSQERLARFQREAETLAALDHPNIVAIHSVEEAGGVHFLAMQLVEGKRLSDVIPKGGMPLERIFEIAIPLAQALAAAHENGIIHRDLKPGNIMVTDEGRVKVLDFGLAKLRREPAEAGSSELPTVTLTERGRVLGTVPYMSPEQVEGRPLDHRSDLFSLGVTLYEMATGERPFRGANAVSVMSAILRDKPTSVTDVKGSLPRQLARIIHRCLVKERERRLQTARELAIELEELRSEVASGEAWGVVAPPPKRRPGWLLGSLAAAGVVLASVVAVVLWVLSSDRESVDDGSTLGSATFTKLVFDTAEKGRVSASPDGRFFAYASDASGNWDIYLRRIAGGNAINLTEDSPQDDRQPAFSPDGESIAFRSERDGGGLFIMGATGESVRRVTDSGFFPDWSPDGKKILYSTGQRTTRRTGDIDQRTWIVDLASGDARRLLDRSAMMPASSPNGRWIAYRGVWTPPNAGQGEQWQDLFIVSADGGVPIAVTDDVHFEISPAWSPDGRGLYYVSDRGGSSDLWRVRIDERTGRTVGDPEPMTSGSDVVYVSPSGDGSRVLYTTRNQFRETLRVPFDPDSETVTGPPISITPPALQARHPAVSADGEWIAFDAEFVHRGSWSVGVVRKDGSGLRQVTASGRRDLYPDWSPDGRRIAFYSGLYGGRSRLAQVWIVNADGSGLWLLTDTPGVEVAIPRWSRDGSQLTLCNLRGDAYVSGTEKPWSEEPPTQLPPFGEEDETFCPTSWSPDGRLLVGEAWRELEDAVETRIALFSFESRSYQVLTESLGIEDDVQPRWLDDGRRLLFRESPVDDVFSILDTETGEVREVFSSESLGVGRDGRAYMAAISPDNRDIYVHWYYRVTAISMLTLGDQE